MRASAAFGLCLPCSPTLRQRMVGFSLHVAHQHRHAIPPTTSQVARNGANANESPGRARFLSFLASDHAAALAKHAVKPTGAPHPVAIDSAAMQRTSPPPMESSPSIRFATRQATTTANPTAIPSNSESFPQTTSCSAPPHAAIVQHSCRGILRCFKSMATIAAMATTHAIASATTRALITPQPQPSGFPASPHMSSSTRRLAPARLGGG